MRIIIDLQGLQTRASRSRGVGRYTDHIVSELLSNSRGHDVILALNAFYADEVEDARERFGRWLPREKIVAWSNTARTVGVGHNPDYLVRAGEIVREAFLNSFDPDVIFSPNLQEGLFEPAVTSVGRVPTRALIVSTLHDLVPLQYQKTYLSDPRVRAWYFEKIDHVRRSDLIITVSHASKAAIVREMDLNPDRVLVAQNGIDHSIFESSALTSDERQALWVKYDISKPYILYIGGSDTHKNLVRLIDAYSRLPVSLRREYNLMLAGSGLSSNTEIQGKVGALGLAESVVTPGFISDEDLAPLYKSASCFVLPSTDEGFGLPAAEAMACGVVTLGSQASGVGEVIEHELARFDPYNVQEMSDVIARALTDQEARSIIIESGLERVSRLSWRVAAEAIWDAIEVAVKRHSVGQMVRDDAMDIAVSGVARALYLNDSSSIAEFAEAISDSFCKRAPGVVYVDISTVVVQDHKSGIQRVTRAIAGELVKSGIGGRSVRLVYGKVGEKDFYFANEYSRAVFGLDLPGCDELVELGSNDTIIFLDLNPGLAIYQSQFAIARRALGLKIYHVVYDILPLLRPETFWPELCAEFRAWARAVTKSDGALCISRAVASEFSEYIEYHGFRRRSAFKVGYFHLGADLEASAPTKGLPEDAEEVLAKLGLENSFLVVGTIEPRKGHRQTLAAFETLWSKGYNYILCFVGRVGWGMDDFVGELNHHPELGKRFFWLSGISDEYLDKIYSTATCLIAPSEGEGFGLPLIEAAQKRKPLLVRDIPVFREVAESHAAYFEDSRDPTIISDAVVMWVQSKTKGSAPLSDGMSWLTWSESARQFVRVLEDDDWSYQVRCLSSVQPGETHFHDSASLDWTGFSVIEDTHRWTAAKEAAISFNWPDNEAAGDLVLRFGTLGEQRIKIEVNGEILHSSRRKGSNLTIVVPLKNLKKGGNRIKFYLPDAKPPTGNDARLLAMAFNSMSFG